MANSLFNRFGNPIWVTNQNMNVNNVGNNVNNNQNNQSNILSQLAKLKNNPGAILDILLQNGKINQQQYNELLPYKNRPELIGQYLINNGKSNEIHRVQSMISGENPMNN